jgi:hypothetical protein
VWILNWIRWWSWLDIRKWVYCTRLPAGCSWLMPVILATWGAEIRKIMVWGQPGQMVLDTTISKITRAKIDWGYGSNCRVLALQASNPEFKPQAHQKKKNTGSQSSCSSHDSQLKWETRYWGKEVTFFQNASWLRKWKTVTQSSSCSLGPAGMGSKRLLRGRCKELGTSCLWVACTCSFSRRQRAGG